MKILLFITLILGFNNLFAQKQFEINGKITDYVAREWGCFTDLLVDGKNISFEGCPNNMELLLNNIGTEAKIKYEIGHVEAMEINLMVEVTLGGKSYKTDIYQEPQLEKKFEKISHIIKNGSNNDTYNYPGGMPSGMASGSDIDIISKYIANGFKNKQPNSYATCAGCHGANGEGIPYVAPRINPLRSDFQTNKLTRYFEEYNKGELIAKGLINNIFKEGIGIIKNETFDYTIKRDSDTLPILKVEAFINDKSAYTIKFNLYLESSSGRVIGTLTNIQETGRFTNLNPLLNTPLRIKDYKMYIHTNEGKINEVRLNNKNNSAERSKDISQLFIECASGNNNSCKTMFDNHFPDINKNDQKMQYQKLCYKYSVELACKKLK